jgi:hypothetical protein
MTKAKWIWLGALALIYAIFWVWHGGNGDPIGEAEGEQLLIQMEEAYGVSRDDPAIEGEGSFIRNMVDMIPRDDGKEFYAVNLERLKQGDEAEAADQRYASMVMPLIFKRGGYPVFVGRRAGLMLGDYGAEVDRVAVVRYRSLRDMIDMVLDPAMQAGSGDKFLSLDHTEVMIIRPMISFAQMRLIVAAIFILLGVVGLLVIGRFEKKGAEA